MKRIFSVTVGLAIIAAVFNLSAQEKSQDPTQEKVQAAKAKIEEVTKKLDSQAAEVNKLLDELLVVIGEADKIGRKDRKAKKEIGDSIKNNIMRNQQLRDLTRKVDSLLDQLPDTTFGTIGGLGGARGAAYETSAMKLLMMLCETEATWRKKDSDRNGMQDYWTLDVAGFFYAQDADGNNLQYIDISTAKADPLIATNWSGDSGIESPYTENGNLPRNGYFFSVLTTDGDGEPYLQTTTTADLGGDAFDGASEVKVGNRTKFGFVAWPAVYGQTGCNTFIVNQSNNVYFRDLGTEIGDNGAQPPITQWPCGETEDPAAMTENPWAFATD